ncbi:MAG TPA: hypothetical protein VIV59_09165, partial [Anaeromyxobacteraceae bacterium]
HRCEEITPRESCVHPKNTEGHDKNGLESRGVNPEGNGLRKGPGKGRQAKKAKEVPPGKNVGDVETVHPKELCQRAAGAPESRSREDERNAFDPPCIHVALSPLVS